MGDRHGNDIRRRIPTRCPRRAEAARLASGLPGARAETAVSRPGDGGPGNVFGDDRHGFSRHRGGDGRPYIQHRGGPKGFIKVLDPKTLAFADFAGNRQYITLANLGENDKAYLFLVDFASRHRVKIWGRARVIENDPDLLARLADETYRGRPERVIVLTIEAWDTNCPSHITPRFTEAEIKQATAIICERIAGLERELAELRARPSQQHALPQ